MQAFAFFAANPTSCSSSLLGQFADHVGSDWLRGAGCAGGRSDRAARQHTRSGERNDSPFVRNNLHLGPPSASS